MKCPYCGNDAELLTGREIYPHRQDLFGLKFWACLPCIAWVGTHKNSKDNAPLGILANPQLRIAKMKAHAAFDPLWRSGKMSRKQAYSWLSKALDIPKEEAHIGMFNAEMCMRVVKAVGAMK
jgi:hypothetical protein